MSLILVTPYSPKLVMVLSHPGILIDPCQTSSDVVREFPHICICIVQVIQAKLTGVIIPRQKMLNERLQKETGMVANGDYN